MATCTGPGAQGRVARVRCEGPSAQGHEHMVMCTGPGHKVRCTGPGHKVGCTGPWALGLGAHVMVSCTRSPEGDQTVISKCTFQNSPRVNSFSSQSIHKHKNNNIQTSNSLSSKSNCSLINNHYANDAGILQKLTKVKRNQQGEEL